jgi:endonuclease/exonuclease/phosphatase family metal-dependent hydrolase
MTMGAFLAGLVVCLVAGSSSPAHGDDGEARSVTIATWNLEWFYDDFQADNSSDLSRQQSAPTRADWDWKRREVARVIAALRPTIMCLQEVENRDVVYKLLREIEESHGLQYRYAFIDGFDFATGQDVAIIYQYGLVEYSRREQTRAMYDSGEYYNLSKHLIARFELGDADDPEELVIFNCHLRAMPEQAELRQKQTRLIRHWMADSLAAGANVIITGDINSEENVGAETPAGEIAILRGLTTPDTGDDLLDVHASLPADQSATHVSGRQYDRIFFSAPLAANDAHGSDLVFTRAAVRRDLVVRGDVDGQEHWDRYYQLPADQRDLSDHYPLIAEFVFQ